MLITTGSTAWHCLRSWRQTTKSKRIGLAVVSVLPASSRLRLFNDFHWKVCLLPLA